MPYQKLLLAFSAAAVSAFAGQINSATFISGPIAAQGGSYNTPFVNNDNAVGVSPNSVNLLYQVNGNAASVIGWNQLVTGGVTEYQFTLQLLNNTGTDWTGYYLELLNSSGNPVTGNPLDFDFPNFDSPVGGNGSQWLATQHTAGILSLNGAPLLHGQVMTLTYAMDVPDPGGDPIQFRMTPVVATPEPGSVLLVGAAVGVLGIARRFRRA